MSDAKPDQKKDLTNLMDYAKNLEANGQGIPVPQGSVMVEQAIEKVADFESLEDYGKHHPVPEAPSEPASLDSPLSFDPPPADLSVDLAAPSVDLSIDPPAALEEDPFATTPDTPADSAGGAHFDFSDSTPDAGSVGGSEPPPADPLLDMPPPQDFGSTPDHEGTPDLESSQDLESSPNLDSLAASEPDLATGASPSDQLDPPPAQEFSPEPPSSSPSAPVTPKPTPKKSKAPPLPDEVIAEKLRPAPPGSPIPPSAIDKVRDYSERAITHRAPAQASYPFSVMITGRLAPEEQSRLIDIVTRENLGLREIDLEPMLASGRVLIPRISEYAGILIVAALRTTRAKIRMGPSDEIYATDDTREESPAPPPLASRATRTDGLFPHAAEELPVTTESVLAELPGLVVIDVISASAILETREVEAERSSEYQEILEALQRELKFKAFRKGARALLNFTIQLTPLRAPTQYRLTVLASAVR